MARNCRSVKTSVNMPFRRSLRLRSGPLSKAMAERRPRPEAERPLPAGPLRPVEPAGRIGAVVHSYSHYFKLIFKGPHPYTCLGT